MVESPLRSDSPASGGAEPSADDRPVADQPALAGLAPRRRKRSGQSLRPAGVDPVAHVVLDVQAVHLGVDFDYLIPERFSESAVPGSLVRVRFGTQRVNGVIWSRSRESHLPLSELKPITRVLAPRLLPADFRSDIEAIADAYGGTRSNILRLAVPPRSAAVDSRWGDSADRGRARPTEVDDTIRRQVQAQRLEMAGLYDRAEEIPTSLDSRRFAAFVMDSAPGVDQCETAVAWIVGEAIVRGVPAVVVLPTMRSVDRVAWILRGWGLTVFGAGSAPCLDDDGSDIVVMAGSMPPAHRYQAFRLAADGRARCVLGPRAAMYAPVSGRALFVVMDDCAYQQADGMMPYAQARGVMRLRAHSHDGVFVSVSRTRSVAGEWECGNASGVGATCPVEGPSSEIRPTRRAIARFEPAFRWLNRENLTAWGDPTVGARIPRTAARVLEKSAHQGPVLLSIPQDMAVPVLGCVSCHRRALCNRCMGPLAETAGGAPRCLWCGASASTGWACRHCGGRRMAPVRVGAAGTVRQISALFPDVPIAVSSPSSPDGLLPLIDDAPRVVVAVPGYEPRIRSATGGEGAYGAVAILDAWTSLYAQGIDARYDVLMNWMRVLSYAAGAAGGGRAMLIGETDPLLVRALESWDGSLLAAHEMDERAQTGLPPSVCAASVWGARPAVMGVLRRMGAWGGDIGELRLADGSTVPSVLGPVPMPPPRTLDARELEETRDRVKAVVRVPHRLRSELARRLREQSAWHMARREPGELRFAVDPKDFL